MPNKRLGRGQPTGGRFAPSAQPAEVELKEPLTSPSAPSVRGDKRPVKWEKQLDGMGRASAWVVKDDKGMAVRHLTKIDGMARRMRRGIPPDAQWKCGQRYYTSLPKAKRTEAALLQEAWAAAADDAGDGKPVT